MTKLPFVLSRKIKISISRNLKSLIDKTYTETIIKELLIDLREIVGELIKAKGTTIPDPKNSKQKLIEFRDICDCIAHSNRDHGVLEVNIRNHTEKIACALNNGNKAWSEVSKVDGYITEDSIFLAMLATIFFFLSKYDKDLSREQFSPIFEDKSDIGLCIISLLQDTTFQLKHDHGNAILMVLEYEGNYRLYCSVSRSTVDKDSEERTGGSGHINFGFPVIVTTAKNIDNLRFSEQNDKSHDLIEAYRGEDNKMHVRFVD